MFQWTDSLRVGEGRIDQQHQQLIALCNRLSTLPECTSEDARRGYHEILNDLAVLLHDHFNCEEVLLERNRRPNFVAHRQEHLQFQEKLGMLLCNSCGGSLDFQGLQKIFENYINQHLVEWDLPDKAYFHGQGH